MTPLRIYVASAFAERPHVRTFHELLRARGHIPTATWPTLPGKGPEPRVSAAESRSYAATNDADLLDSDLLVLFAEGGREALCEARLAIENEIAVVWVGPTCLSAFRSGVVRLPHDAPNVLVLDEIDRLARTAIPGRSRASVWRALNEPKRDDRTADVEGCAQVLAALGVNAAPTMPAPADGDALLGALTSPRAFDSSARLAAADLDEEDLSERKAATR